MNDKSLPFWQQKSLQQMTQEEWESLCDGCAKCCLIKLQDEDTDQVAYTNVVCRYMDQDNCQCTEYQQRNQLVPHCVWLKPEMVDQFFWLPDSCAYRLVAEGKPLPSWHHLISGSRNTVHQSGNSVKDKVLNEAFIAEDDLQEYIIHWVE
ncbi:MAG: YcgN family cysteine cluster protein [Pseudomonadales bacterium]|nr:YcgN family cysteine cluster protein [Pseudomonadales bacterium]